MFIEKQIIILKYFILNSNDVSQYYYIYSILDQIISIKRFLSKAFKIIYILKHLHSRVAPCELTGI